MSILKPAYPLVCVYWKDITAGGDWIDKDKLIKWGKEEYDRTCITVGYLITKTPEFVILAGTWANFEDEESFNDYSMIMCSIITKTVVLKEK